MDFAPGAYRWAALPLVVGGGFGIRYPPVAAVGVALALGVLLFFRDPRRVPPTEGIIAPADGKVSVVRSESAAGGDENGSGPNESRLRVGIFMNVWNVHVNRAPVAGEVTSVTHEEGAHRPAFTKDSERNERVRMELDADEGEYELELIAGAFARRITPYVEAGDDVACGDRVGHIAFGSRVDVVFPPGYDRADLAVESGDRVRAGETVLVE